MRRILISVGSGHAAIAEQQSPVDLGHNNMSSSNTFMSSDAVSMATSLCTKIYQAFPYHDSSKLCLLLNPISHITIPIIFLEGGDN